MAKIEEIKPPLMMHSKNIVFSLNFFVIIIQLYQLTLQNPLKIKIIMWITSYSWLNEKFPFLSDKNRFSFAGRIF